MYSFMCRYNQIYIHFGKLDTLRRNLCRLWKFLDVKNLETFRKRGFEITTLYDVAENSQFFFRMFGLGISKDPLWDPRARCVQHLQRIFQRSLGSLDILDFVIGWTSAMWSCMELLILRLWKLMVSSVPGVKLAWIVSCLPNSESLRGLNKKCRQASPLGCCWLVLLPCSWTFDIQCDASQLSSCSCHSLWGCHLQRSDYNKHWVDEDHSGAPKIAKLVYD